MRLRHCNYSLWGRTRISHSSLNQATYAIYGQVWTAPDMQ